MSTRSAYQFFVVGPAVGFRARVMYRLLTVALVSAVTAPAARADAFTGAGIELTLFPTMNNGPGAWPDVWDGPPGGPRNPVDVTNTFGWAFPNAGDALEFTDGGGVWGAMAVADAIPVTPGFPLEGPHADNDISGTAFSAAVDSWCVADANVTNMTIDLHNLTGSGGGAPPPQNLWMDWNLDLSWYIDLVIDDPVLDYAEANLRAYITFDGTPAYTGIWDADTNTNGMVVHQGNTVQTSFSFMVPPNSVRAVSVDVMVHGSAEDLVPEPGTWSFLVLGALAVPRRRRQGRSERERDW